MNPLSVDHSQFLICESAAGERIGFGQIRMLQQSRSVDSDSYTARPGSGDIEAEADEAAWEDFESEADSLPKTLLWPWSPGYKALEERAALQRARRRARVAQARADASPLWELASVHVDEGWRGVGVGGAIVERLLEQHERQGRASADIYLLTLSGTTRFYERVGFELQNDATQVPQQMAFEVAAGEALSALLGNKLVCMRMRGGGGREQ